MIQKLKKVTYHLLQKSERHTKTDMVYLASGGFWLTLKMVVAGILALALSIAFANLLPPQVFGEYKYFFSIFGLLAITALPGLGSSVIRSVAKGFEGTTLVAVKTRVRWAMIGSFGSAIIALYYYIQGNNILAGAFLLGAIFLPVTDTLNMFNTILTGKRLFKISVWYEASIQAVSISAIILAIFLTNNLIVILATYFIAYTTTRFIVFLLVLKRHATNKKVDTEAISYGKHLSVMEILGIVANTVDTILLWQFLGAVPLAVYSFAKAIPAQINSAFGKIATLALPKFAQRNWNDIRETMLYRITILFLVVLIAVATYIALAPYIFNLLFPKYLDAIIYSQIFALTLLAFPKKMLGAALNAHARKRELYIFYIATPILKITLVAILIPTFGIMGAIFSEISTQVFSLLLLSFLFFRTRA